MSRKLNSRYLELYEFIKRFKSEHQGNSPSYREMAEFMGVNVGGGLMYALRQLEDFGFIEFTDYSENGIRNSRSIELVGYEVVLRQVQND